MRKVELTPGGKGKRLEPELKGLVGVEPGNDDVVLELDSVAVPCISSISWLAG